MLMFVCTQVGRGATRLWRHHHHHQGHRTPGKESQPRFKSHQEPARLSAIARNGQPGVMRLDYILVSCRVKGLQGLGAYERSNRCSLLLLLLSATPPACCPSASVCTHSHVCLPCLLMLGVSHQANIIDDVDAQPIIHE